MYVKSLTYSFLFLLLLTAIRQFDKIMYQENLSNEVKIELFTPKNTHQLFARLTFINSSDKDLWIEKRKIAYNGTILINCFIIKDINKDKLLEFTGPIARFRAPSKEDFIIIEPYQTYSKEFRIDNKYNFPKQTAKYSVQFVATMFPLNENVSYQYKSNIATVSF